MVKSSIDWVDESGRAQTNTSVPLKSNTKRSTTTFNTNFGVMPCHLVELLPCWKVVYASAKQSIVEEDPSLFVLGIQREIGA